LTWSLRGGAVSLGKCRSSLGDVASLYLRQRHSTGSTIAVSRPSGPLTHRDFDASPRRQGDPTAARSAWWWTQPGRTGSPDPDSLLAGNLQGTFGKTLLLRDFRSA